LATPDEDRVGALTHILDKLGVSSRTEAALLAHGAGLLDSGLRAPD
jgi:hypothetical protein